VRQVLARFSHDFPTRTFDTHDTKLRRSPVTISGINEGVLAQQATTEALGPAVEKEEYRRRCRGNGGIV
jgi:hypothetical protein